MFPCAGHGLFQVGQCSGGSQREASCYDQHGRSCVPLHLTGSVGTFFVETSNFPQKPGDRAQLGDRRNNITCFRLLRCQLLPQILLGNVRRFARKWMEQAVSEVSGNVLLWREQSAWNNRFLMQKYICLLADSLGDYLQTCNVILVVDMAPCHVHPAVFARARRKYECF